MLPGAVIASPLVAALFATVFPPVSVTGEPQLTCPSLDAVERAIAEVRRGEPAAPGIPYRLQIGRAGDTIRADLVEGGGTAVWSRSFASGPSTCAKVADALALIVERQFREVTWKADAAEAAGTQAAPVPAAAPSPSPAASLVATDATPPGTAAAPRLVALLGPAFWTRTNTPGVTIEARARLTGSWQAGLGSMLPPSSASTALSAGGGGTVHVTAVPILVSLGAERPVMHRLSLQVAAEGLVTFERGKTESIAQPAVAWRTMLSAGVGVGAAWALGDRLRLDARLSGYRTLLGRPYAVDGLAGTVLDPPAWQGLVRVGVGWTFSP